MSQIPATVNPALAAAFPTTVAAALPAALSATVATTAFTSAEPASNVVLR